MSEMFTKIVQASTEIYPQVLVTPLEPSNLLSALLGCQVSLKYEHMQRTGSFKFRGASNKMRLVPRGTSVLTASTGNHGAAVSRAGALAGVPVKVFLSSSTPLAKRDRIRALGAEVELVDGPHLEAELAARRRAKEEGLVYISPYNDPDVIAGQGTLGVELFKQDSGLDAVFVTVGAGGLISGVGTALKAVSPRTKIVGVWPENSPCMLRALEAGRIVAVEEHETLSDSSMGEVEPGSITFPICQSVIDSTVVVSEAEIAAAMLQLAETEHLMVEGAAGVALAGLIKSAPAYQGRKVAAVLCGRNIAPQRYLAAISGQGAQ